MVHIYTFPMVKQKRRGGYLFLNVGQFNNMKDLLNGGGLLKKK